MSGSGASSALLLDTHILVWMVTGDRRLNPRVRDALLDPRNSLVVSAVIAWEYADLYRRGRLPGADFGTVRDALSCQVLDLPADLWQIAATLPPFHGDPTDRMLIAHAIVSGSTLVSADRKIAQYPIDVMR